MIDRLRALLDRPLDPSAARAIIVFASAILIGFAALFVLANQPTSPGRPSVAAGPPSPVVPAQAVESNPAEDQAAPHPQDPQDVEGSLAARHADRALRSHRAIQHVPYRRGELAITLAGARGDRALLRVSAPDLPAARRGWRAFLRRYHDRGKAYIARFVTHGVGRSRSAPASSRWSPPRSPRPAPRWSQSVCAKGRRGRSAAPIVPPRFCRQLSVTPGSVHDLT